MKSPGRQEPSNAAWPWSATTSERVGHGLTGVEHAGDPAALGRLTALLDTPDPAFPIVTP